jgi:hypothetical protein
MDSPEPRAAFGADSDIADSPEPKPLPSFVQSGWIFLPFHALDSRNVATAIGIVPYQLG